MKFLRRLGVWCCGLVVSLASASAQTPIRLAPPDLGAEDRFGCALSLAETTLVVGALNHDARGADAGAVYAYELLSSDVPISQPVKLFASDAGPRQQFGFALDFDGRRMVVGAPGSGDGGAAYLFERLLPGQWRQLGRLADSALGPRAAAGSAVAINGPLVAVGAPRALRDGAVTVFNLDGTVVARLTPDDRSRGSFGWALAFDGVTLAVGAPGAPGSGGTGGGRVYVYLFRQGTGFVREAVLTAPDGEAFDAFGFQLALAGNQLVVGAPLAGGGGAVYTFARQEGAWVTNAAPLFAPVRTAGHHFGAALALAPPGLWVGAPGEGTRRGTVTRYFPLRGQWLPSLPVPNPAAAGDELGIALDVQPQLGLTALGAFLDSRAARHAGAVYLTLNQPPEEPPPTEPERPDLRDPDGDPSGGR